MGTNLTDQVLTSEDESSEEVLEAPTDPALAHMCKYMCRDIGRQQKQVVKPLYEQIDKQYKTIVQQMGMMQVANVELVNTTSKQMEVHHQQLTEPVNSQLQTMQAHIKKIQDDIEIRLAEDPVPASNPSKGRGRWGRGR